MDFLNSISSDSTRFLELLARAEPGIAVPACPGWTVADLLWHLSEVQWFWGSVVSARLSDPGPAEDEKPARPEDYPDLAALFDAATRRLQDALGDADGEEHVWTWYQPDQTVGFVRRRQAHEAAMHRVDAEQATGHPSTIDTDLAGDGIDEILRVMIGDVPPWATFEPDGSTLRIDASDLGGRRWGVAFGRMSGTSPTTGRVHELDAASIGLDTRDADGVLGGPAADLYLWLWGRSTTEGLTFDGDDSLPGRLRTMAVDATQ